MKTRNWIKKQAMVVSRKQRSITLQFKSEYLYNRFKRRMKYQSKWSLYSTGYSNRINVDSIPILT